MLTMEQRHNRTFGGLHITNSGKCVNINNFTQSLISNHLKNKNKSSDSVIVCEMRHRINESH